MQNTAIVPLQVCRALIHEVQFLDVQLTQGGPLADGVRALGHFDRLQTVLGESIRAVVHDALVVVILTECSYVTICVTLEVVLLSADDVVVVDLDEGVTTGVTVRMEESKCMQHLMHRHSLRYTAHG